MRLRTGSTAGRRGRPEHPAAPPADDAPPVPLRLEAGLGQEGAEPGVGHEVQGGGPALAQHVTVPVTAGPGAWVTAPASRTSR